MRPRRLELRAIGSYAGEVTVDFDELSPYGLFHISGPTGSGKSSLLDGICFALYGKIPPPRRADGLRSHHAAPQVLAQAALEFSAQGCEWRVVRVPSQSRAKKSGKGTTVQLHEATLHRLEGGRWRPFLSKPKEVDGKVQELLGLDAEQFMQVVVLPQGGFQKVLRAQASEREALLSTLFHTERFDAYTNRLKLRAETLASRLALSGAKARGMVSAARDLSERILTPLDWPDDGELGRKQLEMMNAAANHATSRVTEVGEQLTLARVERERLEDLLRRLALREEQRRRKMSASEELARMGELAAAMSALADEVETALRAAPLMPLVSRAESCEERLRSVERIVSEEREALESLATALPQPAVAFAVGLRKALEDPNGAKLQAAFNCGRSFAETLSSLVLKEEAAALADSESDDHRSKATREETVVRSCEEDLAQITKRLDLLRARRSDLQKSADRLEHLKKEVECLRQNVDSAERLTSLQDQERSMHATALQLERAALDSQKQHLTLFEERLSGIAGELAGRLKDGEPCSVCGSSQHPIPALHDGPVIDDAALEAAEIQVTVAQQRSEEAALALRELQSQVRQTAAQAGPAATNADKVTADLQTCIGALTESEAALSELRALEARLVADESAYATCETRLADARSSASEHRALAEAATRRTEALRNEVIGALGDSFDPAKMKSKVDSTITAFERWGRAWDDAERERSSGLEARQALADAMKSGGFSGVARLKEAARGAEWLRAARDRLDSYGKRHATAEAVLSEEDVAPETQDVSLAEIQNQFSSVDDRLQRLVGEHATLSQSATELERLLRGFERELATLEPLRVESERVGQLAELCRGTANDKKMSLERYVLAAYLEEVAAAASQRLRIMTAGRFTLRHSDDRARHNGASGLTLLVIDAHTGIERDVGTLSGGETFLASLALALGLADVVQAHAGGVHIEALFIDEGFGSLDAEALELAMGELDRLRAGGRLVGIISHVPALKDRIAAGIEVVPSPSGSSLRYCGMLEEDEQGSMAIAVQR